MTPYICLRLASIWRQVLHRSWRAIKFADPGPDLHSISSTWSTTVSRNLAAHASLPLEETSGLHDVCACMHACQRSDFDQGCSHIGDTQDTRLTSHDEQIEQPCISCCIGRTVAQSHQAQVVRAPQVVLCGSVMPEAPSIAKAIALEQQWCANAPVEEEPQAKPPALHGNSVTFNKMFCYGNISKCMHSLHALLKHLSDLARSECSGR